MAQAQMAEKDQHRRTAVAIRCSNSRVRLYPRRHAARGVLLLAMLKLKTLSEAETARRRAITGLHNLGREEDADRIAALSTREYATEKGFEIVGESANAYRRITMPRKSKDDIIADLKDQIADLESENEELQGQLDEIGDVISGPDEDEDDPDDDEDEDQD